MSSRRAVDALLDGLPRLALVGGKGGVGKTTCAAALAHRSAARGARTLLLSTDPARALPDALGRPVTDVPAPVAGSEGLHAAQLDAAAERARFLGRWRETIATIVDRGTYLDRGDVDGLVDAAMPGADETFAVLALADVAAEARWERVVVDTAPTGHTLRLLALPETFEGLLRLLDTMQEKHRFVVRALTHRYRADAADAFLVEMRARVGGLRAALGDAARVGAVLVARPEPLVAAETARYAAALPALGVGLAALVVNAVPERPGPDGDAALEALAAVAGGVPRFWAPRLAEAPAGLDGVVRWGEWLREGLPSAGGDAVTSAASRLRDGGAEGVAFPRGAPPATKRAGPPPIGDGDSPRATQIEVGGGPPTAAPLAPADLAAIVRPLAIVGGKGGVGKTTVACALAVSLATPDAPLLLVSTDPAPSVGDALALDVGDEETPVPAAPGLVARQMDASAAFARLRATHEQRVDAVFDNLLGGTFDAAHDRAVVRDLLRLAPPGVDELYALSLLGEALAEGKFARVLVDPAPTGHLLRLLEMPALALEWSHRVMRLMLKYKEVAGLGDAASELLAFARRTRQVGELLRDPARGGLVAVALDEPLVRAETARLVDAVRALGVDVVALVWNRAAEGPAPLETSAPASQLPGRPRQLSAPPCEPPPRGVAALRAWAARWTPLSTPDPDA